ncbi:MAG: tyrosine-protein phosphatase [Gammaproteobacteria bacterium]
MDWITEISVTTTAPGTFTLAWPAAFSGEPVTVFAASSPETLGEAEPAIAGSVGHCTLDGFPPGSRQYFRLCRADGVELVVAERNVPLEGAVNFRDLGGYATVDGRRVRWGRLFRSGHLSKITPAGRTTFERLGIETVCDFRLATERARENMVLPPGVTLEGIEIPPGVRDPEYFHRVFRDASGPDDVADAVHEVVLSMVNESADRYRRLFEVLLEPGERNILINCSAGKERTGIAAALLLSALGVPRETIYYDFMLSAVYFPAIAEIPRVLDKYAVGAVGEAAQRLVMPLLETRASYLQIAFDSIDRECGSADAFLRRHYDLGEAEFSELRRRYLS